MAIDWDATGSMLQGWAGLGQIVVLAFAAYKAADTFKDWRNQRIEDRRIETAERTVSLSYKIRRAFAAIRSPITDQREKDDSVVVLLNSGLDMDGIDPDIVTKIVEAQVVLDRVSQFASVWDELAEIAPVAVALLGQEIDAHLKEIWRLKAVLEEAAQAYPEISPDDPRHDKVRHVLWHALNSAIASFDEFSVDLNNSIQSIETLTVPIISNETSR